MILAMQSCVIAVPAQGDDPAGRANKGTTGDHKGPLSAQPRPYANQPLLRRPHTKPIPDRRVWFVPSSLLKNPHIAENGLGTASAISAYEEADQASGVDGI